MNNNKIKRLVPWLLLAAVLLGLGIGVLVESLQNRVTVSLSPEQGEKILTDTVASLPSSLAEGAKFAAERFSFKADDVTVGTGRSLFLHGTYQTVDVYKVLTENKDALLNLNTDNPATGKPLNATQIQILLEERVNELLSSAPQTGGEITVELCQTDRENVEVYLSDEVVNALLGGILDAKKEIMETETILVDGKEVSIGTKTSLRTGLVNCIALKNYSTALPETSGRLLNAYNSIVRQFRLNFLDGDKWIYLLNGLLVTLEITGAAIALGILIGFLVAVVRVTNQKTGKLYYLDAVCRAYLSVIRGTPVMVQLLIIHFVILLPLGIPKFLSAVLCFGLNSGAYVAEIVRGGIMSVDIGQTEAGRSLGFTYGQTMLYIVIPQAFKAVLPALANEFIALLKETSVAFYIGVADLTQGGLRIRSITYSAFMPLIAVAVIYWIVVMFLTWLVSILERRLRKSER